MSNVLNRTQRDSEGSLIYMESVHTPDYPGSIWLINPNFSSVAGVPSYYWKVVGDSVVEMNGGEKNAVDATRLSSAKTARTSYLNERAGYLLEQRYNGLRDLYLGMYSDAQKLKPKKAKEIQKWIDWINTISENLNTKTTAVHTANTVDAVNAITIDESSLLASDPLLGVTGVMGAADDGTLDTFLNASAVVTDPVTNISGPFYLMQLLEHRKELYNDSENPLYDPAHTPILGDTGMLQVVTNRVAIVENIHAKLGWHNQEVQQAKYTKPKDLLIYYGWLNSFNSATNLWNNEKVAQEMAKYGIIVLGDGIQDPSHGDYANTQVIIPRVKALNPNTIIFGYVAAAQSYANFQTKTTQWDTLQVHGIFIDEAGYDYGKTRAEFNQMVDYVHGKTCSKVVFANAWNSDHVLGTADDVSFPNSTYNSGLVASNLNTSDWVLLESYPINTASYTSTGGYESSVEWAFRGAKAVTLRATYGVNFAGSGVIANSTVGGQNLFGFGYVSSLMFSLDAFGTSDTNYGASSAAVTWWNRVPVYDVGLIWSLNPTVNVEVGDTGMYHRYVEIAKISLKFAPGGYTGIITKW